MSAAVAAKAEARRPATARLAFLAALLISCASATKLEPLPSYLTPLRPAPPISAAPPAPLAAAPEAEPFELPGALPAVSLGEVGVPGAVELLGSSAMGAWVALCDQERRARLVIGSGPGEPIDGLLADDPSGRYVVVLEGGHPTLVDAAKGTRVDLGALGADARRLRADYAAHRALSFDGSGQQLAYLRRRAGEPQQLVVRQLEAGTERAFPLGAGELLRLELSADGQHVVYEALRGDTNGNGRLDWPAPEEAPRAPCEKPPLRFRSFAYQGRGDAPVRGVVALKEGVLRDVPDLVTPLGPSLLLRSADGSLVLEHAGRRQGLAPAACGGRVLFADADRGLVLAACAPPPPKRVKGRPLPPASGKREVWLFGAGLALNLQRELYETSTDRGAVSGARLVPLYPGNEANVLDLERRELFALPPGSRVLATEGQQALVWRDNDLYRYDAHSEREERLARGVAKNPELLRAGSTVLLSPFLVVGVGGATLSSPPRPLAITKEGFVLTGSSDGASAAEGVIQGPLQWVDARLPPLDGPPR